MAHQAGGSGWENRPLQSKVTVSVATAVLSAGEVLDLVQPAVAAVEDDNGWLRVGERSSNRVAVTVRDMTRDDPAPALCFDVELDRAVGRVTARTVITSYEVRSSGVRALVPVTKRRLVGFSAYRAFMDRYVALLLQADPRASGSFSGD